MKKSLLLAFTLLCIFILGFDAYAENSAQSPEGYRLKKPKKTRLSILSEDGTPDVLLIQTALPWESNADTTVLNDLGYSYREIDMNDLATTNIGDYQVVLIVNDQVQSFYDSYAENYDVFDKYVTNGGTLVFFACDHGWAGGDNYTDLPGHVEVGDSYDFTNSIANSNHPIITQEFTHHVDAPIIVSDMQGTACSHNYFVEATLPDNADIIIRDINDYPSLVHYKLGNGNVIASGITWEYTYYKYERKGEKYGFGRALPDVFKFAFTLSGGHKVSGMSLHIFPEDNFLTKRPRMYKAKGDLIDVIVSVDNDTGEKQTGVSLRLKVEPDLVEPDFLYVYYREAAEKIALNIPQEITDYDEQSIEGFRTITLSNLTIPKKTYEYFRLKKNEYIFRFKLRNTLTPGEDIFVDTEAQIFGDDIEAASKKLSDGGPITVIPNDKKIIITNRELMYRKFASNYGLNINRSGVNQLNLLWESLYSIAEKQQAVIYHIDKYDRDDDDDRNNNITIDWMTDREKLDHGSNGSYEYDDNPLSSTQEEINTINQVAIKIDTLLDRFIDNSGGSQPERYVAIIGGDDIIPFFRAFDPSSYNYRNRRGVVVATHPTVYHFRQSHDATNVTRADANNNYLFTDIIYRDYDGEEWENGNVENIYVGRIVGCNPDEMRTLLISSNKQTSNSRNVVKLENNMRNGELDTFHSNAEDAGYNVVTEIDGVNIDVDNVAGKFGRVRLVTGTDDPAVWTNFFNFYTGEDDITDFDIMRFMCHGSVTLIADSEGSNNNDIYFTGRQIFQNRQAISNSFNDFSPFLVFDACLVGIVDGLSSNNLFNALLPTNTRGLLGSSGVTWTPYISDFNDLYTNELMQFASTGKALNIADRTYINDDILRSGFKRYTVLQMNIFGLPWASVTPPGKENLPQLRRRAANNKTRSVIRSQAKDQSSKKIIVDTSTYQIQSDIYDLVVINDFKMSHKINMPVLPENTISVNIPLNATLNSVNVTFSNEIDAGQLNIPAFFPPPPMPDDDAYEGGFIECPQDVGVYPETKYYSSLTENVGFQQVNIKIMPVVFNAQTKETTIYGTVTIDVNFTTPNQGITKQFTSDQRTYTVGSTIQTTTAVENISANDTNFAVTVELQDLKGTTLQTNTVEKSIPSNTTGSISVDLPSPAQNGLYQLVMSTSDGYNVVGNSIQDINVIAGKILSFNVPDSIEKGKYGTFEINFANYSQEEINVFENVHIYNANAEQVASLPQLAVTIPAGISKTITTQWFPSNSLLSDKYWAHVVVSSNDITYSLQSDSFLINNSQDIVLLDGWNLISLSLLPADTSIETVLGAIVEQYSSVWTYVNGAWQFYSPQQPGFSDLSALEPGKGYWINMDNSAILPVSGSDAPVSISLTTGWNLVGYNESTSQSVADALSSISGKFQNVWTYKKGAWQLYDPVSPGFSDLTILEPGRGYWIKVNEVCTWSFQ